MIFLEQMVAAQALPHTDYKKISNGHGKIKEKDKTYAFIDPRLRNLSW